MEAAAARLPEAAAAIAELEEAGLVVRKGGRFCPTERGWLCGNELYGRLYDLAP